MTEFNRDVLQRLLERLDKVLERAGAKVTIRVIGGAALMTRYGRDRTTTDVDYERIKGPRGIIEELAKQIGAQERIRSDWMNQDGRGAIPEKPDPDEREVFRGQALTVIAAGPRHLLAMKLAAKRDKDSGDVTHLARHLGLTEPGELLSIFDDVYEGKRENERPDVKKFIDAVFRTQAMKKYLEGLKHSRTIDKTNPPPMRGIIAHKTEPRTTKGPKR